MNIYNYYALATAILNQKYSVDTAINEFSPAREEHKTCDESVIIEMIRLKKTMSFNDIGKIYGVSKDTIYRRIKRFGDL